jgi:hypothetical protein
MKSLLLYALLALNASPAASPDPPLADGTLLFLENASSVVEYATRGKIGHVALVFADGQDAYVYEATPGDVRRVQLAEYFTELARINQRRDEDEQVRVLALRPKQPYSAEEAARMRKYLDSQVGRRYSVRNYVRSRPADGIHCAELASTALNQSQRHAFEDCHHIHPQSLYTAMKPLSAAPLEVPIPPLAVQETWCVRAQRRTGQWFTWCGWSFHEAWSWCW